MNLVLCPSRIVLLFWVVLCGGCDHRIFVTGPISWQPDGAGIAFGSHDSRGNGIYLIHADGSTPRRLTTAKSGQDSPAFSPDGRLIAFVVRDAEAKTGQIWLMDADGRNQRPTARTNFSDNFPSFSPDGRKLLFSRAALHRPYSMGGMTWDRFDVWEMNLDGTEQRQLTHGAYRDIGRVSCSPDATNILFSASGDVSGQLRDRIFVMVREADGSVSSPRVIEIAQPGNINYISDAQPRFSPDGRRIVFVSSRVSRASPFDYEVWTADPDGTHPQQVTHNQSYNTFPTFSPDGNWILFRSDPARISKGDLWKIRCDGTQLIRLTAEGRVSN